MKKTFVSIITLIAVVIIMAFMNIATFADNNLTPKENASFITRDEFNEWRDGFIASLSELEFKSTQTIYNDMNFYDMQYRFTDTYKNPYDPDTQAAEYKAREEEIEKMIIEEKKKRGLL